MDNTKNFDGKSAVYEASRPGYAPELFGFIRNVLRVPEGGVFADVGSGTGIFTEQLLKNGYRVYAVEPNAEMRKTAEEKLSKYEGFASVDGTGERTGLAEGSVDCVSAAQSFHWLDPDAFLKECRRILVPGGLVLVVYNRRDVSSECSEALAGIDRRDCPRCRWCSGGMDYGKIREFFGGRCETFQADNDLVCDRQGYIARALSSSFSLKAEDEGYEAYVEEIGELFDRFAVNGRLTVPMPTAAWAGRIN